MAFLLDTNSWIHYLKHADSPIRVRLESITPSEIVSCSVVRAELLHWTETAETTNSTNSTNMRRRAGFV